MTLVLLLICSLLVTSAVAGALHAVRDPDRGDE